MVLRDSFDSNCLPSCFGASLRVSLSIHQFSLNLCPRDIISLGETLPVREQVLHKPPATAPDTGRGLPGSHMPTTPPSSPSVSPTVWSRIWAVLSCPHRAAGPGGLEGLSSTAPVPFQGPQPTPNVVSTDAHELRPLLHCRPCHECPGSQGLCWLHPQPQACLYFTYLRIFIEV